MDFEEFLMAAGETDLCDLLRQPDWEILKILSLKYVDLDRKSTRLNSSHVKISYAVFCLKKKKSR